MSQDTTLLSPLPEIKRSFYVEPEAYGSKREREPPAYVSPVPFGADDRDKRRGTLFAGLDFRNRTEYRVNDVRRPETFSTDVPFLIRTRAYLGASEFFGFLGGALEVEDARLANSNYAPDVATANYIEPISAVVELKFRKLLPADAGFNERPILLRAGRMNFEMLDRRLIANNYWRNTTNTFQGLRAAIGNDDNDWSLDLLALQPLARVVNGLDTGFRGQMLYGAIGHWRKWSHIATIEPYYLLLHQSPNTSNHRQERMIHNAALRLYGFLPGKRWNYDLGAFYQFGMDSSLRQRANAFVAELGYFISSSKYEPRISAFFGYAGGDKNPGDNESNRFFRFYGFGRPWQSGDYMVMENIIAPKLRLEAKPFKGGRLDLSYCHYWLASATDRMPNLLAGTSRNRDITGNSGKYLGNGVDMRLQFKLVSYLNVNTGYSFFSNGDFIRNREEAANGQSAPGSHFAYLELTVNLMEMGRKIKAAKSLKNTSTFN